VTRSSASLLRSAHAGDRIAAVFRARVITCSDSAIRGEREDRSGPAVRDALTKAGFEVDRIVVVADELDSIAAAIEQATAAGARLVVTTGGTGIAPRDVTPEATMRVCQRIVPGFGELMRLRSLEKTPMAPLSRAQAATRGAALVINLPGSTKGAVENLESVLHLIPHALELLGGERIERHP
jgi:molybdopterin adenylyltransferase